MRTHVLCLVWALSPRSSRPVGHLQSTRSTQAREAQEARVCLVDEGVAYCHKVLILQRQGIMSAR